MKCKTIYGCANCKNHNHCKQCGYDLWEQTVNPFWDIMGCKNYKNFK